MAYIRKSVAIVVFALLICMAVGSYTSVYANSIKSDFNGRMTYGQDGIESTKNILSSILGIIRIVGMTIAVVMLVVVACKYMLSAPGDRADLKKYIPIYITGAIVLFGASGLVGLIRDLTEDATGG